MMFKLTGFDAPVPDLEAGSPAADNSAIRMRLSARNEDLVLLGGLILALLVIFSQALESFLDFFRAIDNGRGLRLLQALIIIGATFAFHQVRKRQRARDEAIGAAAEARQATEHAAEMERLVGFGQALARSLNEEAIQAAATAHITQLAGGRGAWALLRTATHWKPLTTIGERLPRQAIARTLVNPTAPMPSFRDLPPEQFDSMVEFLAMLKATEE